MNLSPFFLDKIDWLDYGLINTNLSRFPSMFTPLVNLLDFLQKGFLVRKRFLKRLFKVDIFKNQKPKQHWSHFYNLVASVSHPHLITFELCVDLLAKVSGEKALWVNLQPRQFCSFFDLGCSYLKTSNGYFCVSFIIIWILFNRTNGKKKALF